MHKIDIIGKCPWAQHIYRAKNLVSLPPYGTFILLKNSGCKEDAELMTFRGDMQI
jgi:hypothetical protein